MKFMKSLRDLISRIKWNAVFGVIALILLILLIVVVFIAFNPLAPRYRGTDDVQIRSWAEPGSTDLKGKSTIYVDIKNSGDENIRVNITLSSRTDKLWFADTGKQQTTRIITLGRGESRKPEFEVRANATDSGTYGIDIKVSYDYRSVEDEVYLKLAE